MLNNPTADAELFLSEWIQCVKIKNELNEQHAIFGTLF